MFAFRVPLPIEIREGQRAREIGSRRERGGGEQREWEGGGGRVGERERERGGG